MKDRYNELFDLSIQDPEFYYEPGYYDESKIDPEVFDFLRLADKAKTNLDTLKEKLIVLKQLHAESLGSTSDYHSRECRRKVADVCENFSAIVGKTRKLLHRVRPEDGALRRYFGHVLEEYQNNVRYQSSTDSTNLQVPIHRLEWMMTYRPQIYVPAEVRMQILQYNVRSLQLKELCHKFFTMQKTYNDQSRAKINRQISIIQNVITSSRYEDDSFSPDSEDERRPFLHPQIRDETQVCKEMQDKLRNVHYFEREIYSLERNITKLYDSYLFVSNMVFEQGAMVDRVEHHINTSADYVDRGAVGLKKARTLQDKYRTKKLVLFLLLLVLLAVIIIIITVSVEKSEHEHDHKDHESEHDHDHDHHHN